jgi:hypothetical protein
MTERSARRGCAVLCIAVVLLGRLNVGLGLFTSFPT